MGRQRNIGYSFYRAKYKASAGLVRCKGKLTDKTEQNSPGREEQVRRRPPETGFLKLNVDAAMCTITHMYTLGMIIRNDTGQFLMGKI